MIKLELIMFDVGHGLSVAIIEHPNNYVTLFDLGGESDFSPLLYLRDQRRLRPDVLYITHPHADHIFDIGNIYDNPPDIVYCQDYDWDDVVNKEQKGLREKVEAFAKFIGQIPRGSYSGECDLKSYSYSPEDAKENFGEASYINNSSVFSVFSWRDFKISIAGDLETKAIEGMCNFQGSKNAASGTDIFIAPHHGHKQGFTNLWPTEIGKPYISLISVQSRDEHVDPRYRSVDFAKGVTVNGAKRYSLTTRQDGMINISMWYENNKPKWSFVTDK